MFEKGMLGKILGPKGGRRRRLEKTAY